MIFRTADINCARWGNNEIEAERHLIERVEDIPVAPELSLDSISEIVDPGGKISAQTATFIKTSLV